MASAAELSLSEDYNLLTSEKYTIPISRSVKIKKEFIMDRIASNKLGNARLENQQARTFIRYLTDFYQKNKRFRYLAVKEIIVNMGVQSTFMKNVSIGKLPDTYEITKYAVNVKVDFRQLRKKHPQTIFVLNEQS